MGKKINLAIIGCGAAAVTLLRSLIEYSTRPIFKITLFDSSGDFGVGLAYQNDLSNLIINRPVSTMSAHAINLEEFHRWVEKNHDSIEKKLTGDDNFNSFLPRKIFGIYLQDVLYRTIEDARSKGIEVVLVKEKIAKIKTINPYVLESSERKLFLADHVVLCTGNNLPKDVYYLNATPLYVNNPYPMKDQLGVIDPSFSVGIIGNSLTAIDVAISLKSLGHQGPISMMSRTKNYPRVRGEMIRSPLHFLNVKNIEAIRSDKKFLTLRDVLRLFRKEFSEINCDWRLVFRENSQSEEFLTTMKREVEDSDKERKWQSILSATNQIIETCWHYLDQKSKALFISKFNRAWLKNRSPIPKENAKILIEMSEMGQLHMRSSLETLQYLASEKKYIATFKSEDSLNLDCIINATGPSKHVQPADHLLYYLMKRNFVRSNIFGGVEVEFESSSVIDADDNVNPSFRLIGHNTSGVHYYTSSLEMIAKRSRMVAASLINSMTLSSTILQNKACRGLNRKIIYQDRGC